MATTVPSSLSLRQPLTIEPQQIGQFVSVTSIGLPFGRLLGVNEHDFSATLFSQVFDQPIIEPTDLQDCHELGVQFDELHEERFDLFGAGTDLPT
jgi:hypothetical protein